MRDAEKAYKNAVLKRKGGEKCNLPKCRRKTQKSFFILGNAITKNGIYPKRLGKLKTSEPLPDKPCDSVIMFIANKFYLRVVEEAQTSQSENQGRVCSLDPCVRSFLTGFSLNKIFKIQQNGFGRLVRLAQHADDLQSRTKLEKSGQSKKRMWIAFSRMKKKIKDLVDDLHYQSISYILSNFGTIILPNSDFTSAVDRVKRKIGSKTVRSLLTFAFARFRDRLIYKANLIGKKVVLVCESYTSKTANWIGEIKPKLSSSKTISSNGLTFDRDIKGALRRLPKALLAQPLVNSSAL